MRDHITLGPTPCEEDCFQVGTDNYRQNAIVEMNAYIDQLYRMFPEADKFNVFFNKMWFNHDFGQYGEVVVSYDDSDSEALSYAINIEHNLPHNWDDEAIAFIKDKMS